VTYLHLFAGRIFLANRHVAILSFFVSQRAIKSARANSLGWVHLRGGCYFGERHVATTRQTERRESERERERERERGTENAPSCGIKLIGTRESRASAASTRGSIRLIRAIRSLFIERKHFPRGAAVTLRYRRNRGTIRSKLHDSFSAMLSPRS